MMAGSWIYGGGLRRTVEHICCGGMSMYLRPTCLPPPSDLLARYLDLACNPSPCMAQIVVCNLMQPKQYVAGSSRDTGENSNNAALLAGAVGVGILAVGLIALRGTQPNTAGRSPPLACPAPFAHFFFWWSQTMVTGLTLCVAERLC